VWPDGNVGLGAFSPPTARHPRRVLINRDEENTMDPQLIEWGPAHLRDEAMAIEVELDDRPDDN